MDNVFSDGKVRVLYLERWREFDRVILYNIWIVNLREDRMDELCIRPRRGHRIILRMHISVSCG